MCGIVGAFGFQGDKSILKSLLLKQLATLSYRGPDAEGIYVNEQVGLGHRRLSVIDLTFGGQPMIDSRQELALTFNGEIYNFIELRTELKALGAVFLTSSDTEVLLHGYRIWGQDLPKKLNGMFSFCLYDARNRSLFCARDPFGQKPFFYANVGGVFYFASETKALTLVPAVGDELNSSALRSYLYSEGFPFDESIYKNIKKLPPGFSLTVREGQLVLDQYFDPVFKRSSEAALSFAEARERVDARMREGFKLACRSDVPIGILLSGGLDSAMVLSYFRQNFPSAKVTAFNIYSPFADYDESPFAEALSKKLGVELVKVPVSLEELATTASTLLGTLDEPQADPGLLPKYLICAEVSRHVKVVLGGDGGDELFYGYLLFKAQQAFRIYKLLPTWFHRHIVLPIIRRLPNRSGYMRLEFLLKQFVEGVSLSENERIRRWMYVLGGFEAQRALIDSSSESRASCGAQKYFEDLDKKTCSWEALSRMAYRLQKSYLPDYVLCNSDRVSMRHSLEMRSPFLDIELVRLVNGLPDHYKMRANCTKYLLKKVAEEYLPRKLIYRKKIGFTIPVAQLLRGPLREELHDILSPALLKQQGLFDGAYLETMLKLHDTEAANLYKPLWTVFTLQKWLLSRTPASYA